MCLQYAEWLVAPKDLPNIIHHSHIAPEPSATMGFVSVTCEHDNFVGCPNRPSKLTEDDGQPEEMESQNASRKGLLVFGLPHDAEIEPGTESGVSSLGDLFLASERRQRGLQVRALSGGFHKPARKLLSRIQAACTVAMELPRPCGSMTEEKPEKHCKADLWLLRRFVREGFSVYVVGCNGVACGGVCKTGPRPTVQHRQ